MSACFGAKTAHADGNDFTLERLYANSDESRIAYRSLLSQYSVVLAPRPMTPADTLGYAGFSIDVETTMTQIDRSARYWQRGVEAVTGAVLPTLTVRARKGVWLPLPSCEIGLGGTKLFSSDLFSLEGYVKFAVHEGFHRSPAPSVALRLAASHMFGSAQVALSTVALDLTLSKRFAIRQTFTLDPYLGGNVLLSFAQAGFFDTTPNIDAYKLGAGARDLDNIARFSDPGMIVRGRVFAGLRLVYTLAAFTLDVAYAPASSGVSGQTQLTFAAAFRY